MEELINIWVHSWSGSGSAGCLICGRTGNFADSTDLQISSHRGKAECTGCKQTFTLNFPRVEYSVLSIIYNDRRHYHVLQPLEGQVIIPTCPVCKRRVEKLFVVCKPGTKKSLTH